MVFHKRQGAPFPVVCDSAAHFAVVAAANVVAFVNAAFALREIFGSRENTAHVVVAQTGVETEIFPDLTVDPSATPGTAKGIVCIGKVFYAPDGTQSEGENRIFVEQAGRMNMGCEVLIIFKNIQA